MVSNSLKIIRYHDYILKNFIIINNEEKDLVLRWRNNENIRKWMYNTELIKKDNHYSFVENLKKREDCKYWLVYEKETPFGVLNVTNIDKDKKSCELGYYLNPDFISSGEGFFFVEKMIRFVFEDLCFEDLYGAVNLKNKPALLLDLFFGFEIIGKKNNVLNSENDTFIEMNLNRDSFLSRGDIDIINYVKFIKNESKRIY